MNYKITEKEKTVRDDRIAYIYLSLYNEKTRNFIHNLISELGITSNSTAERVCKEIEMWSKQQRDLFFAVYTPQEEDVRKIKEILGEDKEKITEKVVDVDIDEKCKECSTELAGKIAELQKELRVQKCVIDSLQKDVIEKDETIAESKIAIMEVCKERDDKAEELRVARLELQKYKNDIKMVIDNRQKLECLLSVELNSKYDSLYKVLLSAYNQAANGKGKERHQLNNDEPFEKQKICEIARRLSVDYNLGQAVKKIYESKRLTDGRDIAELYGAINYIAAAIIVKQENNNNGN